MLRYLGRQANKVDHKPTAYLSTTLPPTWELGAGASVPEQCNLARRQQCDQIRRNTTMHDPGEIGTLIMVTDSTTSNALIPNRAEWMVRWFQWYATRYIRKHFHALRLSKTSAEVPKTDQPIIIALNHPAWWDPLICVVLSPRFGPKKHYAPIDAQAIEKYRFFRKLGFFGVEPDSTRGAIQFLRTADAIFSQTDAMLWVTAQGQFTDVRQRPIRIRPGIGHVAARLGRGWLVPLAIEYPFWQERTPEILVRFGPTLDLSDPTITTGKAWTERIEAAMTDNQDRLAAEAIERDPARFEVLHSGKVGIGGIYDMWRRLKAWIAGKKFDPSHASATTERSI